MEETEAKEQLLEGMGLLAGVEEGGVTDRVIQVTLHQVGPQALHTAQHLCFHFGKFDTSIETVPVDNALGR